jgi:hypothetical protein
MPFLQAGNRKHDKAHASILGREEGYLGFYIEECPPPPPCSKNIGDGPIKWLALAFFLIFKEFVGAPHSLIKRKRNCKACT